MNIRTFLTLIAFGSALALGGPLAAQDDVGEQQQVEVSDQQLEQFVAAQTSIVEIQQDFSARLEQVDDPEDAHALQVEANEEMTSAVEEAGLNVESYNAIAMAIQNDPELQERLSQMMEY